MMVRIAGDFQYSEDVRESFFIGWDPINKFEDWYKYDKGIDPQVGRRVLKVIQDKGTDDDILEALGLEGRLALACQCLMLDWFWKSLGNNLRTVWPAGVNKAIMVSIARTLMFAPQERGTMNSADIRARFVPGNNALGRIVGAKASSGINWAAMESRFKGSAGASGSEEGRWLLALAWRVGIQLTLVAQRMML
jgi:hypothetical protein